MMLTRPELVGDFGMVASTHWLASATGMSVLERGGNAADAAAAAGFVLQVVEPHLNGPGGEVPIMVSVDGAAQVEVICGQGVAPQAATTSHFAELGLDIVPGTGLLPAVVPGAFGAWMLLVERYGSWSVRDVMEPAISLAEDGHPLLANVVTTINSVAELFRSHWPTSAATWLPGDRMPQPGERFRRPAIAATYRRILEEAEARTPDRAAQFEAARDVWYRGFVAEEIERFFAGNDIFDTSGRTHRGLLTANDMAAWEPSVENAMTFDYGEYTVCKPGPWCQGPVFLQQLALLANTDLASTEHLSADWVHTIVEASKLAYADREAWYGDPRFTDVPMAELLAPGYNQGRARLIGTQASYEQRPGSPGGRSPARPTSEPAAVASGSSSAGVGEPTAATDGDTCHLDVVDRDGLMISATPSGGWLQSSPTIPSLGFCLSNRGQMFWLEDGLPNSLRPGARPRTTLSPSIALRDGKPYLAFGTPGGDMQDQWSLHFFLNVAHGGLAGPANLQRAIDSPDFHSLHTRSSFYPRQAEPGRVVIEDRYGSATIAELARRGHDIATVGGWSLGRVSAVARDGDWLKAGANPRSEQGYACGR
jgi:gamma-glutamyltranspeptidase / glutathione hydrolase